MLGSRVALALTAGIAVLVAVAAGSVIQFHRSLDAGTLSRDALEVIAVVSRVLSDVTDAETGQRGYLLTGDPSYLSPYRRGTLALPKDLALLRDMLDDPAERGRVEDVERLIHTKLAEMRQTIELYDTNGPEAALEVVATDVGRAVMDRLRRLLGDLREAERARLRRRLAARESLTWQATVLVLAGLGVGAAIIGLVVARLNATVAERRASEQRLQVTLHGIADAVVSTDAEGCIVFSNEVAQRLSGRSADEMRYQPLADVLPLVEADGVTPLEDPAQRVMRHGGPTSSVAHVRLVTQDQRRLPIEYSGAPLVDEQGVAQGAVVVFRDASERLRTAAERERRVRAEAIAAEAEAASAAKDQFLAVLSHELRTPLSAMLGWVVLLRQGNVPPERVAQALETIERNVRLQTELVNDLLDVSRIVAGKLTIEATPMAFGAVVKLAVENARPAAAKKGVGLELRLPPVDPVVRGDAARLHQVTANLVSNAVKFTPSGGHVDVELSLDGSNVRLTVRDTGTGIAPDVLPRIFDRFQQADASSTRRHGGLGLGLAIVRHLVERHGGSVAAESVGTGKGATFTVLLPRVVAPADAVPQAADQTVDASALRDVRVLLVEDQDDVRAMAAFVLAAHGAVVTEATGVHDALHALARDGIDVVVTDLAMPGQSGYTLLERMREGEGPDARLPVIALTGMVAGQERERALAAGFTDHVPKPVEPQTLVRVVRRVVDAQASG